MSENTLNSYLRDIEQFLEYLDGRKISAKDVSGDEIGKYIFGLESRDVRNPASTVCFRKMFLPLYESSRANAWLSIPRRAAKSSKPDQKVLEI